MLDLYHVLVPVFSIITLLNVITLKLALRDNVTLSKIVLKKQPKQLIQKQSQEENQSREIIKFLLVSFTPMEFFTIRRAKYKIGFFFALALVTIASYFLHSPFATSPLGAVVFLIYIAITIIVNKVRDEENQQQQSNILRQQYIQIGFCIITLIVDLIVIGIIFKNYQNSILTSFVTNACINAVLDNFLIRPLVFVLIGFPLSKNTTFIVYMKECKKNLKYLELYDQIGQKQMLLNHEKRDSPHKNMTKIQLNLEIEPLPFQQDVQHRQEVQEKEEQKVINNAIDILRKIKNELIQPPLNINLDKHVECQISQDNLLNINKQEQYSEPLESMEKQKFQQIPEDAVNEQITDDKGFQNESVKDIQNENEKDLYNENLIRINPSHLEQVKNQEQIATGQIIQETEQIIQETDQIIQDNLNEEDNMGSHHNIKTDRNDDITIRNEEQNGNVIVKINLQSSIQPSSRQQPLRIFLNSDINFEQEQKQQFEQDFRMSTLRRKRDFMTIDQNRNRNAYGVLQIKKQNVQPHSQEIEEIDLNSPQKKRRQKVQMTLENIQQESKMQVVKRKKKRHSHDNGVNRVVKFTTGQPYLEYLPFMLEKDTKAKKSQSINKKDVIMDNRAPNTGKKTKKRLVPQQNNENLVHVFRIEDL